MASVGLYTIIVPGQGQANGIATLDSAAQVPVAEIPTAAIETFKGQYATSSALTTAYPAASLGDYAYVTGTSSYWYWNSALSTADWVNQQISESAYNALSTSEKAAVPYIVGV